MPKILSKKWRVISRRNGFKIFVLIFLNKSGQFNFNKIASLVKKIKNKIAALMKYFVDNLPTPTFIKANSF